MHLCYTIEIEITNFCNANCIFCGNKKQKRKFGFIDVDQFQKFIDKLEHELEQNFFHSKTSSEFPKITFGGLGEPLLHPDILKLTEIAASKGFSVLLITNGALLTENIAKKLVQSGLKSIAISLHTINEINYFEIMKLSLPKTLNAIKSAIPTFIKSDVEIQFWRIHHPDFEFRDCDDDLFEFNRYIDELGCKKIRVLGPSEPWERDGIVMNSRCEKVEDSTFWCNKILGTFNIAWNGDVVLCCVDYFRQTVSLGNVFSEYNVVSVLQKKSNILKKIFVPLICKNCRRWEDSDLERIFENYTIDTREYLSRYNELLE